MIALAGGEVRCMPYATFGTAELAEYAVRGLEGRRATLLANHGVDRGGAHAARRAGGRARNRKSGRTVAGAARRRAAPQLLDDAELARVIEKFAGYGRLG